MIIIVRSIGGIIIGVISVGSNVIFLVFAISQRLRISSSIISSIGGIIVEGISVGGRVLFMFFLSCGAVFLLRMQLLLQL